MKIHIESVGIGMGYSLFLASGILLLVEREIVLAMISISVCFILMYQIVTKGVFR